MDGPSPSRYSLSNLKTSAASNTFGFSVLGTAGFFAAADDFGGVSGSSVPGKALTQNPWRNSVPSVFKALRHGEGGPCGSQRGMTKPGANIAD